MNIITLLGSPKEQGNTAFALNGLETLLTERGQSTTRFHIAGMSINGCRGCGACQQASAEGCCQEDDCREVFEAMTAADGIVYATPLYGWDFSGQMKQFLDRHFSLQTGFGTPAYRSALAGRRSLLLVTCFGEVEGNADLIQDIFDRFCQYTGMKNCGKFVLTRKALSDADAVERTALAMADALS
jgi:multimeric flavodoxin WrbA